MCLASAILTIPSGHWFWLSLAGLLLLLIAGLHTIWICVSYAVRSKNLDRPNTTTPWLIPDRLYIPWRYLVTWGRMVRASKWVREHVFGWAIIFGVAVGMPLGWWGNDFWQSRPRRIHVLQDLGNHQYTIACAFSDGCRVEICGPTDPGFDSGDWIDTAWEERSNGHGGICISYEDQLHTWWRAVPGHAKNREVVWTSQQQNQQ